MSLKPVRLGGETVIIHDDSRELFHWIREGPYLKAGKIYGWSGPGFGVNYDILRYAEDGGYQLCIISGKRADRYYKARVPAKDLLKISEALSAIEKRGNTEVLIVPFTRDNFQTIIDPETVTRVLELLGGLQHEVV